MAASRLATQRLAQLEDRLVGDDVLRAEVAPFLARPAEEWEQAGVDLLCRVGKRVCRLTATQIEISHDGFTGSKRIPL